MLLALLLAGCGGPGAPEPTAIPADVARPAQSTPVFSTAEPLFRLSTETPAVILVTPTVAAAAEELSALPQSGPGRGELLAALLMNQPPSAMGIAVGGATLLDAPGGAPVTSVPGAATLTVTGRSADGNWLAVFTEEAITGWVPAGSLVLYGADDLTTVTEAFSPAPVATMIAEAMRPVATPMSAYFAALTATPPAASLELPTATPMPASGAEALSNPGTPLLGTVASTGNLNLRAVPSTDGRVVASLPAQSALVVLGRTQAGDWLRVRTPAGDGWVLASFVVLDGDPATLPVTQ